MCRWHPHSAVDRLVSTVCRWASNLHTSVHPHWSSRLYREMTTEHGLMKVSFPHCCLGFCCQAILTISVRSVNCVSGYRPQNRSWILFLSHSVFNPSGNHVNPAIQTYLDSDHFLLTIPRPLPWSRPLASLTYHLPTASPLIPLWFILQVAAMVIFKTQVS